MGTYDELTERCLDGWARQGVLMLNACLVRKER